MLRLKLDIYRFNKLQVLSLFSEVKGTVFLSFRKEIRYLYFLITTSGVVLSSNRFRVSLLAVLEEEQHS